MVKVSPKNFILLVLVLPVIVGVVLAAGCAGVETPVSVIEDVTAQEAFALIQENENNPDFIIIDVRTPEEYADGHIEGAVNLDYNSATFRDELNKLDKNKMYLVHCRSGSRSRRALEVIKELGFQEVYHMSGGIIEWTAEGLPTIKNTSSAS